MPTTRTKTKKGKLVMAIENAEKAAAELERTVNSFGSGESTAYVVDKMLSMHRTLNQKFTGEIILPFVREMAKKYDSMRYDLRNEAACKLCRVMWNAVKTEYGLEGDDFPFGLPCI